MQLNLWSVKENWKILEFIEGIKAFKIAKDFPAKMTTFSSKNHQPTHGTMDHNTSHIKRPMNAFMVRKRVFKINFENNKIKNILRKNSDLN